MLFACLPHLLPRMECIEYGRQQVVLRPDERLNKVPLAAAGLSQASLVSSQTTRLAINRLA